MVDGVSEMKQQKNAIVPATPAQQAISTKALSFKGEIVAYHQAAHKAAEEAMENLFLFEDLPFHARLRVGRIVNELFVTPNQTITRQGDAGDTLYVVVQGQVSVQVDNREVAVLSEGEHFGELALIDTDPRSATVVARGFGHLLTIERDALREYCMMEPALGNLVLWKLIATLGQRLRRMNTQLSAAST